MGLGLLAVESLAHQHALAVVPQTPRVPCQNCFRMHTTKYLSTTTYVTKEDTCKRMAM